MPYEQLLFLLDWIQLRWQRQEKKIQGKTKRLKTKDGGLDSRGLKAIIYDFVGCLEVEHPKEKDDDRGSKLKTMIGWAYLKFKFVRLLIQSFKFLHFISESRIHSDWDINCHSPTGNMALIDLNN